MNRLWVAAFLLSVPATAIAHHGWSSYDASKTMKITAPLTDVRWGNPHGSAKLTWQKRTWDVVLAPVARMEQRGLSKDMLSDGKPVTLEGYPRRDGAAEMRIERITAHGKTVELR
ncbi:MULTISPECIES: DUF6152 family protein [unclassified Sphingobium]|uniref:DUF6152 family protein n=1 Tax=unclassified Sphingobium TaxID=2611147 RepID=UPI0007F4709C|nr:MULTISPECIES: DUF6152 family protein [unclassified Sphingobium]OAN55599.1 hypothetical protein A7Q26_21805 [Sphingobium sp. TCM1]WIW88691.1 DUF6152 family protein [Sphingobium sp. V4]